MVELAFGVAGYAACGPLPDAGRDVFWPAQDDAREGEIPRSAVPVLLRRRITPIGQAVLRAAWSLPGLERARFVFASRHGEFSRTLTMLEAMADDDAPLPADFSLSVHNALPGLLSIGTRGRAGHTALAAGVDSFGFGLMEAGVCLLEKPDEPVMLAYYDEALPAGYPDTVPAGVDATLALALMLVPPRQATRHIVMAAIPVANPAPHESAAAVFLRFLRMETAEASVPGERMRWTWRHV